MTAFDTAIIIPARYGSTRFPGKPLAKINGKEMLHRVWDVAEIVCANISGVKAFVATDDERIADFCKANSIDYIMTSVECKTGTDRAAEAIQKIDFEPEFVVNLQGDNPLCPPWFVESIIKEFRADKTKPVVTPVVQLAWQDLDILRKNKQTTPFSGTCALLDKNNDALAFSKNIIPAIRKEDKHRQKLPMSPVLRHIGLYGYRSDFLMKINELPEAVYEEFEGLEQMRFLENGISIRCVKVDYRNLKGLSAISGVDSPEDLARVAALFTEYGEFNTI